jgi:hypothetical protein
VTYQEDMKLRDLEDGVLLELVCLRCRYTWIENPLQVLLKVDHRDVTLDEVARHLSCKLRHCRSCGVKLSVICTGDTSGFVGGMP